MQAALPPLLSGLPGLLLRRPPSLREMVTIVGTPTTTHGSTGWCATSSPTRRRRTLSAPDVRTRVERFARLFAERHFPLHGSVIEYYFEVGDEPPWSWLRRGIPFELMGIGYDGLHEMWDGYREGISALALLVRVSDSFYDGPDGLRTAGWNRPPGASRKRRSSGFPRAAYPSRPSPKR